VPLAFGVMVLASLLTPRRVHPDVARVMVRLHAPESLDLALARSAEAAHQSEAVPQARSAHRTTPVRAEVVDRSSR
jgi:hypothetical protein